MTHHTDAEQLHQLLELVLTELDRKAIPIAYMQEIDRKGKAFIEQAARRAPAAPVPQGWKLVPEKGTEAMARAFRADDPPGYFCMTTLRCADFAERYAAMLAAAPQPPEAAQSNSAEIDGIEKAAAPVQLPEPDSYCFQHEETGLTEYVDAQQVEWGFEKNNPRWKRVGAAYSEQQVRQLLAAHSIKEQST